MVEKRKGTRVFVYARCFGITWCDEQNLEYDKKLSGIVQHKFKKHCIVKMDIDGADEEVDLDDVHLYQTDPKGFSEFCKKRKCNVRKRKKQNENTTILIQMVALVRI